MIVLDGKLTDYFYEIEGHIIRIRIEPPEFRRQLKEISELVDNENNKEALARIDQLPIEWQNDEEFVRLLSYVNFVC